MTRRTWLRILAGVWLSLVAGLVLREFIHYRRALVRGEYLKTPRTERQIRESRP